MNAHPLADLFPLMDGQPFEELCADIKAHGLRHKIVTLDGMILDGRNRERACVAVGVEPEYIRFEDTGVNCSPWEFVASENLQRRHLTPDQRAAIVVSMVEVVERLKAESKARQKAAGGDKKSKKKPVVADPPQPVKRNPSTRDKLAKAAGVTTHKIRQAETVKRSPKGADLEKRVVAGEKTLAQAVKEAAPAPEPQPFDTLAESRQHRHSIERDFEKRCDPTRWPQYKADLQQTLAEMWDDENWVPTPGEAYAKLHDTVIRDGKQITPELRALQEASNRKLKRRMPSMSWEEAAEAITGDLPPVTMTPSDAQQPKPARHALADSRK